jgi:hypothetical protein
MLESPGSCQQGLFQVFSVIPVISIRSIIRLLVRFGKGFRHTNDFGHTLFKGIIVMIQSDNRLRQDPICRRLIRRSIRDIYITHRSLDSG